MQFSDQAIIISSKQHGETSLILKILTKNHGIYKGFVKGARSNKKKIGAYQIGNIVKIDWYARLEDSLGSLKIELEEACFPDIFYEQLKFCILSSALWLIDKNLAERQENQHLYEKLLNFIKIIKNSQNSKDLLAHYVFFELDLLANLGYGLQLQNCAASGAKDNLIYVSPKSAQAVCAESGEEFKNKLLVLPEFILNHDQNLAQNEDIKNGLHLSGYFIKKHLKTKKYQDLDSTEYNPRNQLLSLTG